MNDFKLNFNLTIGEFLCSMLKVTCLAMLKYCLYVWWVTANVNIALLTGKRHRASLTGLK